MIEDHASATLGDSERAPEPTHTPGPWAWDSRNGGKYLVSCAPDPPHLIVIGWPVGIPSDTFGIADALLIAAAPDLLAALKAIIDGVDEFWMTENPGAVDAAQAAIDKAEGSTPAPPERT